MLRCDAFSRKMLTPLECFWRKKQQLLGGITEIVFCHRSLHFEPRIVTFNEPSARSSSARASPWKTSDCCKSQISFNSKKWVGKKKLVKIWESFPNSWCTEIENCLKPLSSDEVFQHLCTNSGCFCLRFCLRNATDEELCRVEGCFAFSVQAYFGPYRPYQKLVQNKSRIH